jgi:hypothetical protein
LPASAGSLNGATALPRSSLRFTRFSTVVDVCLVPDETCDVSSEISLMAASTDSELPAWRRAASEIVRLSSASCCDTERISLSA